MNLDDLKDHVIICGWNRSARTLLEELRSPRGGKARSIIILAEQKPTLSEAHENDPSIFFIEGDYTRTDVLEKAGVERASRAILLADKSIATRSDQDRDARTILAAMMIEKVSPGIFTCAELLSRDNIQHLLLAGIEEVVIADDYSGTLLAASSRIRGVTEIADEIFSSQYGNQFYKREIPSAWIDKSFLEVQKLVKEQYDALAVAVERAGGSGLEANLPGETTLRHRTVTNPPADFRLHTGDWLITIATEEPKW